jgi:hypothetical protein
MRKACGRNTSSVGVEVPGEGNEMMIPEDGDDEPGYVGCVIFDDSEGK